MTRPYSHLPEEAEGRKEVSNYYGILAVETDAQGDSDIGAYQIIGEMATEAEAIECAREYAENAGPGDDDTIPPDHFIVWMRNSGRYSIRLDITEQVFAGHPELDLSSPEIRTAKAAQ